MKIIVTNQIGRPKNPFEKYPDMPIVLGLPQDEGDKWKSFEQSATTNPAPGIKDGEHEAILIPFFWDGAKWVECNREISLSMYDVNVKKYVWRLSPSLKEAEVKQPVNLSNKLNDVRQQAMDVILNAMSGYKDYHFPLMQVSWLKSFVTNPQYCNHVTKGNLELWSTDSLCSLADTLNNLYNPPQ